MAADAHLPHPDPTFVELGGLVVRAGDRELVRNVGLRIAASQIVALVGASGSGKTLTARAILGLGGLWPGVVAGSLVVSWDNGRAEPYAGVEDAVAKGRLSSFRREVDRRFRQIRGGVVGYLPQDARGSLDPLRTVRWQVEECLELADRPGVAAKEILERAGFRLASSVLPLFPHQLSGGMAQRVSIALALARDSRFLVADEPTTGLDPTVQEEILAELRRLTLGGVGILLITHDLRVVTRLATQVLVMSEGSIAESLAVDDLPSACSSQARTLFDATARVGRVVP
jgi:peptide/nickel transport system ATP-binding protein